MIISPPFLPPNGLTSSDPACIDPMMDVVDGFELPHHGVYPIAFDRRWHCGVHLQPKYQNDAVRAIADGEVVAYRVAQKAITDEHNGTDPLKSNTGFVLLKHTTDTGDGRTINFYSLYMHLLDLNSIRERVGPLPSNPPEVGSSTALPKWLAYPTDGVQAPRNLKVYRKDILGYPGKCHDQPHLHFEIFMTEGDFAAWFEQAGHAVPLGNKTPTTPASKDYWGHSYFVIPGGQAFVSAPPEAIGPTANYFPVLQAGTLDKDSKLYVEAYFHKGQRYTRSWIEKSGAVTPLSSKPERDICKDYEYDLYARATALYPQCPSDGYEMLRFGRILNDNPTLSAAAQKTWVAVAFEAGKQGYIDISQSTIQKLSDADFPHFCGWQKIKEGNTPFSEDGLCDYDALRNIVKVVEDLETAAEHLRPEWEKEDKLADYIQTHAEVREKLKAFICHAPSEWDASGNEARFKRLNDPDGFFGKRKETDPNGYDNFLKFHTQLQFMEQTPLGGGKKFWFFHPLAFIRHFRKCGWLHSTEMAQCFPRKLLHLKLTQFQPSGTSWAIAASRSKHWARSFNEGARKYGLSNQKQRLLHFFSHVIPETGNLSLVKEIGGEDKSYSPYYGRGLIQLTHLENYKKYGEFRRLSSSNPAAAFQELGWDPNEIIAKDNDGHHSYVNCVDSAGFYVAKRSNMLSHLDSGTSQQDAITVSKDVNGYVAIENLNGLDLRLQSVIYLRSILLDEIFDGGSVSITFDWRRNSQKEPVLDAQGHPVLTGNPPRPKKKFYIATHHINVSLDRQRP